MGEKIAYVLIKYQFRRNQVRGEGGEGDEKNKEVEEESSILEKKK